MFDLTPQEKFVLSGLLAVCLLGTLIHCGLNCDARPLRWVNTVAEKPPSPPKKVLKKTPRKKSSRKKRHE